MSFGYSLLLNCSFFRQMWNKETDIIPSPQFCYPPLWIDRLHRKYCSIEFTIFNAFQIDHFYNTLYICTQVSASLKEAHIHNIRFYHRVHKEPISAEEPICPICGGKLIVRISKRGKYMNKPFLGCSNYPKCKYIKPLKKLN